MSTVQFEFTGLFAFEYWQVNAKKARFVLPDPPQNVGAHAPVLMMPWKAVDHARVGGDYHIPPQPIRIGNEDVALWTLAGMRVWVADFNGNGYDSDGESNLTFTRDPNLPSTKPEKPSSAKEWEDLYWFPDLRTVVRPEDPKKPLIINDRNKLTSEILLTRGQALGRAPVNECDQTKTYKFSYSNEDETKPQVYATQMLVRHPLKEQSRVLELKFSDWKRKCDPRSLFINVDAGATVPVTVMNVPLAMPTTVTHFHIFYGLVNGKAQPKLKTVNNQCPALKEPTCAGKPSAAAPGQTAAGAQFERVSPYDGCIPPGVPQDPIP